MRDAGTLGRGEIKTSQPRLRRRTVKVSLDELRVEGSGRNGADLSHIIGFGILLIAVLLILIGAASA